VEMGQRIRTTIETITADMLQTVWNELDYRILFSFLFELSVCCDGKWLVFASILF